MKLLLMVHGAMEMTRFVTINALSSVERYATDIICDDTAWTVTNFLLRWSFLYLIRIFPSYQEIVASIHFVVLVPNIWGLEIILPHLVHMT